MAGRCRGGEPQVLRSRRRDNDRCAVACLRQSLRWGRSGWLRGLLLQMQLLLLWLLGWGRRRQNDALVRRSPELLLMVLMRLPSLLRPMQSVDGLALLM